MDRFIKLFLLPMVFLLVLSGCATQEKYHAILETWVGASERELIEVWGVPAGSYELAENEKLIVYKNSSIQTIAGTPPVARTTYVGNTAQTNFYGGTSPSTYELNCETTFTLLDGIVTKWKTQGNNCVAE